VDRIGGSLEFLQPRLAREERLNNFTSSMTGNPNDRQSLVQPPVLHSSTTTEML
jgi:hypothetical protein